MRIVGSGVFDKTSLREEKMAENDRRHHGQRGGYNRKRRYRGGSFLSFLFAALYTLSTDRVLTVNSIIDDDDFDRRQQRRKYEEPLAAKVRRQLLTIAESVC